MSSVNEPHWARTTTDVNDATTIHRRKKSRARTCHAAAMALTTKLLNIHTLSDGYSTEIIGNMVVCLDIHL